MIAQLENDPAVKEKFAREHYLMKRDDEVVFSIIREDTTDCNLENK
jgi:cell division protein FtsB